MMIDKEYPHIDRTIELQNGGDFDYWTSGSDGVPAFYVYSHYKNVLTHYDKALARIAELEAIIANNTQQLDAHHEAEAFNQRGW